MHHESVSEFQEIKVLESKYYGQLLITDNLIQSSEKDEHVYHESLVQPAMIAHGNPKKVYIGGGGEGATLREVLKNSCVEECWMVDIDGVCVDMCRQHMPKHSAGAFEDPRTKLIIDDAKTELEKIEDGYFDVIIMDLSDPLDGGPCYQLYTTSFYEMCKSKLAPGGIFVTQSGCASILDCQDAVFTAINNTLKQVFPKVLPYTAYVSSFSSEWGFNLAFKAADVNTDEVFGQLDAKIEKMGLDKLRWYDQITHMRMTSLPKEVRQSLANEKRVMTVENPVFMCAPNVHKGVFEKK